MGGRPGASRADARAAAGDGVMAAYLIGVLTAVAAAAGVACAVAAVQVRGWSGAHRRPRRVAR
jgi:hypothetical protein